MAHRKLTTVVLLTSAFPYGDREQFLEAELACLAASLPRVVVVPSQLAEPVRAVPANVEVDTSLACLRVRGRRLVAEMALSWPGVRLLAREAWTRSGALRDSRVWPHVLRYAMEAMRVRRWALHYLGRTDLDLDSSILYTYWFSEATLGLTLARSHYPALKVVTRAHGADLYEYRRTPAYIPFRGTVLRDIDRVFTVSQDGLAYLRERYAGAGRRTEVLRLGVRDPGVIAQPSRDGILRVLSCAFLTPVKRVDLLIHALRELAAARPALAIVWNHIGDGPQFEELARMAESALPPRVTWRMHGALPHGEVLDFYRRNPVDVFVNTSASEGIPVSIMEALSFGVPVVATAVGGTPEIVRGAEGALLPPDATAPQVAAALLAVVEGERRESARAASRSTWEELCNADRNYGELVSRLKSLAAQDAMSGDGLHTWAGAEATVASGAPSQPGKADARGDA